MSELYFVIAGTIALVLVATLGVEAAIGVVGVVVAGWVLSKVS